MGSSATSLPMLDKEVVQKGHVLYSSQQQLLCQPFTSKEIKHALFSMVSSKAPGIDGFNVHFYKSSWHIIGEEVIDVVKFFYDSSTIRSQIYYAYVCFIPKCENACFVKNIRPIACCSVLYKIISKVLSKKMQGVLCWFVSLKGVNLHLRKGESSLITRFLAMH